MEYDFKGNVVSLHKKFTIDYDTMIDWDDAILLQSEFTTETEYDALNRPVSVVHPDNSVVGYQYDKGGLLQKIVHGVTEHITNITYNPKGQRENIYYGNNTKTRYDYNPLNFRLSRLLTTRNTGQDILQDLNYSYDSVGNIVSIVDDAQQTHYFNNQVIAPVSTFEYDALYRLTKATGRELSALTAPTHEDFANNIPCPNPAANAMQNYVHNYQYDKLGNMLQDAWKSYEYATINNYLLGNNNVANQFTYDAHGNMLTMPHLSSMDWDWKDQLIGASNGTFTSYYNYDVQGNRTRKVVEKGNIVETRYYVGGYEVFRKEISGVLDIERTTVNIADDEKVFVRVDTEIGQSPVVRYVFDNHLGSACLELDEVGAIISYEEYHAFGSSSYKSGRSETEVSQKKYRYCGKERDEETGMYYYGARYYAAWLCRFVSCDPLQFKYLNISPFAYCVNNPIKYIDPDGQDIVPGGNVNKALEDIKSILPEQYQDRVSIVDGLIDFNITIDEVSEINDIGVSVIYDMVTSSDVYSYQVAESFIGISPVTGEKREMSTNSVAATSKEPTRWKPTRSKETVYEVKENGKTKKSTEYKSGWESALYMPENPLVDNERIVNPNYEGDGGGNSRVSVVLHEFLEMWEETNHGLPYFMDSKMVPMDKMQPRQGAHDTAIDMQRRLPLDDKRRGALGGSLKTTEIFNKTFNR